jgi:hypothetical protein
MMNAASRKRERAVALPGPSESSFPGGFHSYKKSRHSILATSLNRSANGLPYVNNNPTVLHTQGRGQVDVPQRLITIAGIARKDEREQRRIACRGAHDMFGPPASTDAELSIQKGQMTMCYLEAGATFRLALQSNANVNIFASTAGLPRSGRYGIPGVAQIIGDNDRKFGSDQVTIAIAGRQTIVPYCPETIQVGDTLYVDLEGNWTEVDGQLVPAIQGPSGLAQNYANLVVRPMPCSTPSAMFTKVEDMLRLKMGLPSFADRWKDVKTAQDVCDAVHEICDFMFANEFVVSANMPIRGYAPIWFMWSYTKMIQIHWSKINIDPVTTNIAQTYVQLLRAMIQTIKDIEEKFARLVSEYAAPLPHSTEPIAVVRLANRAVNKSSVHSHTLTELLIPTTPADPKKDSRNIREAAARVDLLCANLFARIREEQRNFFVSFCVGTALSCATGVDPLDINLGQFG